MEGAFRLLMVVGLLATLLPAAGGPQAGTPCEPTLLATQVSRFCALDIPTALCCEPVVAAVDLGGGVPCLCRVAAEPQVVMAGLNGEDLLALYTSCGGLRPRDAHLAAACEGPGPSPADVSSVFPSAEARTALQPHTERRNLASLMCTNPSLLSRNLLAFCGRTQELPSRICCTNVLRTVDGGCLCEVGEDPSILTSILDSDHMWYLYKFCGGKSKNIPQDTRSCIAQQSPPPPPPFSPPPPSNPPPSPPSPIRSTQSLTAYDNILNSLHSFEHSLTLLSICLGLGAVALAAVTIATGVALLRQRGKLTGRSSRVTDAHGSLEKVSSPPVAIKAMPSRDASPLSPSVELAALSTEKRANEAPVQGDLSPPPTPTPSAPPVSLMA